MDKFFVITNEERDKNSERAKEICEYLTSHRKSCDYVAIERDSAGDSSEIYRIRDLAEDTDAVIVLGGDGTFIQSAGILAPKQIPMIGVISGIWGIWPRLTRKT